MPPMASESQRGGMLSGVRVVELATVIAGPLSTALLADMGADVIKIEEKSGDMFRKMGVNPSTSRDWRGSPFGSFFEHCNRGKRSVVLDLKSKSDQDILLALLADTDVFVTNVRKKALERLGLDYASLRDGMPRLIYGHLTAWGLGGPKQDNAGYDVGAFWAASGLQKFAKPTDDSPDMSRFPGGLGDQTTAIHMLAGILGALYQRQQTGLGQHVEACLFRAGVWTLGVPLVSALATAASGKRAVNLPRGDFPNPTYNVYKCGDGEWLQILGLETERHLPNLLDALGVKAAVTADPRFGSPDVKLVTKLVMDIETCRSFNRYLDNRFLSKAAAEWEAIFREKDVWHHRVADVNDVARDEHAATIGAFAPSVGPLEGVMHPTLTCPIKWSGSATFPRGRAPVLGAHTETVLQGLRRSNL